jgi:peptidoglycan-associated lipoprotein
MLQRVRLFTSALGIACWALGLACAACAGGKPTAVNTSGLKSTSATAQRPRAAAQGPEQSSANVHISDEIRTKCGISDADAYFAFNSSLITSRDRTPLDLVVRCFTSGPLTGHALKLVGRADPRGQPEYNMALGQYRADAVEVYLTSRGLRTDRASSTSRGAMDAVGSDEATWQHDRRVDILLAN